MASSPVDLSRQRLSTAQAHSSCFDLEEDPTMRPHQGQGKTAAPPRIEGLRVARLITDYPDRSPTGAVQKELETASRAWPPGSVRLPHLVLRKFPSIQYSPVSSAPCTIPLAPNLDSPSLFQIGFLLIPGGLPMIRTGAFCLALLCAGAAASAQSAFDGTWKTNLAQTKFSPKPNVFYTSQGWYHCVSCNPAFDVKADGSDQTVSGQPYDTINVKEADPNSLAVVAKKGGKVVFEQTRTVSADGKMITVKTINHPMESDQTVTATATGKRVGVKPSGVHATSGEWQIVKVEESDNGLTNTFKMNGDELTMSTPTGETYTAKLDGTDAAVKGAFGFDTVSLKKVNDHTIEETEKRNGNVIEVNTMTVSGKTMKVSSDNKVTGRTTTYTATKK
jgi:hypothetical protein